MRSFWIPTLLIVAVAATTESPQSWRLEDLQLVTVAPSRYDWLELAETSTSTTPEPRGIVASCLEGACSAVRVCLDGVCSVTRAVSNTAVEAITAFFDLPIERQVELATKGIIIINGVKLVATCSNPAMGALLLSVAAITSSNQLLTIEGYHRVERTLRGSAPRSVSTEIILKPRRL